MKHLFEAWDEVEPRIRQARPLFLLLDYNGNHGGFIHQDASTVGDPGLDGAEVNP